MVSTRGIPVVSNFTYSHRVLTEAEKMVLARSTQNAHHADCRLQTADHADRADCADHAD